jgi:hypothetical protein
MSQDAGIGIIFVEALQELVKGVLLSFGTSVGGMAVLIETSFIDDTKGTIVVVAGMDALHVLGQQRDDVTIATDIIVVAALAIFGFATGYQCFYAERAVALVGYAVDYEQFHCVVMEGLQFLVHSCY